MVDMRAVTTVAMKVASTAEKKAVKRVLMTVDERAAMKVAAKDRLWVVLTVA